MQPGSWTIEAAAARDVRELARELELSELTASVLVRRGLTDGVRARAFLAAEAPGHDPFELGDMAEAVRRIRAAVAAGEKICVHGDYDVDGVSATALAVILLRELGAEVSWALPSRFDEGYGLTPGMLERLAGDGCSLVVTVDCGITAVEEVAKATELGLEVIVTDHHRPGERLPDCPIVAPRPSSYPFAGLCGTGVVYKLGEALFGADSEFLHAQLDLVCLATVADVVPLVDENRWLVTAGLQKLGRTSRPGLRALMRSAGVDPATIDTGQIAFRLAPRINAAGRLGHPGLALELLLGGDEQEAALQARKLEALNRERQAVEDRIQREAVQEVEFLARGETAPARLRDCARGLARGRDRYRRLAAGGALLASGRARRRLGRRLEGIGSLDPRLRSAQRYRSLLELAGAVWWPSRGSRFLDPA